MVRLVAVGRSNGDASVDDHERGCRSLSRRALRERRSDLGPTQAELAAFSGIAQGDIGKIENGRLDPRWSTVKRLADAPASVQEPKTALANGGYRRTKPDVSALEPWKPNGTATHSI